MLMMPLPLQSLEEARGERYARRKFMSAHRHLASSTTDAGPRLIGRP
jgi:hypothetical protein